MDTALQLLTQDPLYPLVRQVAQEADAMGLEAYLVGGFVRDLLLRRQSKDADVMVVGDAIPLAEKLHKVFLHSKFSYFKTYGTANLRLKEGYELEFVGARLESYSPESRNPEVKAGSFLDDISRRDFTINALAIRLNDGYFGELVDVFGGLVDLRDRLIRTPLDPSITFTDDPLRMLRAMRFAAQLGFELDHLALAAIRQHKDRIKIIAIERIAAELNKIILSPRPSIGLTIMQETGLLELVFPELFALCGVEERDGSSHKDNFFHTLKVLDNVCAVSANLWLRWAALLHDIGKAPTKRFDKAHGWTFHGHEVVGAKMVQRIFDRFRLSTGDSMRYVQKLVALHLRPIALGQQVTDSAVRRLIVDAGQDLDDLLTLCKADITTKNPVKMRRFIKGFDDVQAKVRAVEELDELRNWKNPVNGQDIMDTFGLKPGKEVGEIKETIKEAIMNCDIPNSRDAAIDLMMKIGKDMGLTVKPL